MAKNRDETADPPALVCVVGKTELRYHLRCVEDLHAMLKAYGDWMPLGSADEQKPAAEGTVEACGRSPDNPVGGWYGLKKGLRGRFGMYVPPLRWQGNPGPSPLLDRWIRWRVRVHSVCYPYPRYNRFRSAF